MQKLQTVNAETLLYEPLEKPSFVVDSLIPTGLSLFCGSQKIGKSWLMLKLCLCVSQGIPLWDMPTMEGDVLYLCLEDTFCRIQDRLFRLTDEASGRLHFAVASCKLSDGLIVQLEDYLKDYPDSRLIVIDTLQKVRTASKDNAYASDYGDISLIKDFADRHSLAVIVVHHIRKQNDSDVFNKVSGTTGLTGSADATFVLEKEKRASDTAKLYVTGRDTPYQEYTLRFRDCRWELVERKTQEQLAKETIPDVLFRLVDFMRDKEEWIGTATELLAAIRRFYSMAGIKEEKKIYLVGIYCRLSKDDGTDNESASIATQKSILTDYVKKQGWHIAKTYVDDGYSGTNFQRPSFQNMIKDIESGLINCVITKDLSRLGRNYLDCGLYLEVFFPEHNVRYIAVNDGVDTLNKSAMDITPFRNILNEMYAADISVKIKSAYRARFQQGKFMGTTAPYGYIKDPADHNHLLIDDKVAHVVKEIFDLALKGNGVAKICRHLNKQHILRPAAYAAERGETGFERHFEGNEDKRYIWSGNSVRSILRSPIYAGNLVGYKRIAANMKSKKRPSKLPEEWEVIPNTHEGIVTQEEFDIVQQLITSRRLPQNKGGFVNIFAGVIKCVDCGCALRAMNVHRRKRPEIIDCVQYSCNNYARNGRSECSAHNIEARDLFNAVLADINCFADMAVNDEKAVRAIEKRLTETDQSRAKALEKERKKLNKRLAELDRLFSSLYEDKVMERITERNFEMMSGKYQKEQLEIEARLKEVTETLNESYEKSRGIRDFLALIRNYQGLKELDATVINALIDKILVSEREKMADGTVKQEIKIYYKFIGFVDELHIIPTKRWAAMPAKNCTVCGVEYVPGSGASRYCPACAKKIRREKSNESKRRSREQKRIACMNCPQKMTD